VAEALGLCGELLKLAKEFAPGIPARKIEDIPTVPHEGENKTWQFSAAKHPAAVRGDHIDLRLVDERGRAHSWATNRLPEPGEGSFAAQQPTHTGRYALRKKPFAIPPGYGGTRPGEKVTPLVVQPTEVISANNERVHLLRHHGQETDELVLRKLPVTEGKKPLWMLRNVTKRRGDLPDYKPKYKDTRPADIDFENTDQVMLPKLDGSHALLELNNGEMMRVYSYRPTARKTGVIEHTFKFPGFQNVKGTPETARTLVRAEVWGSDKAGKAISAAQLGGILNSSVPNARRKLDEGVLMRLTGIDVVRHKGKNMEGAPFGEKLKVLQQVTDATKGVVELPEMARTAEEKRKLLSAIESGSYPATKEGVVLRSLKSGAPPVRSKFRPDTDVYVTGVFTKPRGEARGMAGGFTYSHAPGGPTVGRVGTGFTQAERQRMLRAPEEYVGRAAKVLSLGKTEGALRAPSFAEWHLDK
jgi:hypothetical protein